MAQIEYFSLIKSRHQILHLSTLQLCATLHLSTFGVNEGNMIPDKVTKVIIKWICKQKHCYLTNNSVLWKKEKYELGFSTLPE